VAWSLQAACSLIRSSLLSFVFFSTLALTACGEQPGAQAPGPKRTTTFNPASEVTGSALATDRVVKINEGEETKLAALGAVRLGILTVENPFNADYGGEHTVWPGASVDAAGLGATHARVLKVEGSEGAVKVQYVLWHFSPQRWSALPDTLRPKPLPDANDARVVTWSPPVRREAMR
jgi:hypothetical protein